MYYLLGWAYLEAGQLEESEQLLAEAARLTRDGTDPLYPCILSLQNAVYAAMRNTEQAAQLQRESLRLFARQAEATGNVFFLARLHANLAQHASSRADFEQADEQLRQALALLSQHNSCQNNQSAYQQLFNAYASQEFYQLANLYAYKWLIARFRCRLPDRRSELTYALGRLLLRADPEQAHSYLEQLASAAAARQDQLTLAGARIQLASWSLARGDLSQAEQLLKLAQEQSEFSNDTLLSADAQLLAGELAYRREDYATGDSCFEAGLALFEKVGAEEDLVEHLAHYAQLLEDRNCMQKSLFYWKLAYEQRKKNHMPGL
jgi:tetratricopeptide (TPR) repeat protein